MDGGHCRRSFDDDDVRPKGVVEAGERLADGVAPLALETSRLLHVPRFVATLRQRTLGKNNGVKK